MFINLVRVVVVVVFEFVFDNDDDGDEVEVRIEVDEKGSSCACVMMVLVDDAEVEETNWARSLPLLLDTCMVRTNMRILPNGEGHISKFALSLY